MSKNKKTISWSLDKIPYFFWVLTAVALGAGLLSMMVAFAFNNFNSNKLDTDYPVYTEIMQNYGDQQPIFYKRLTGAWYISSGTTEMALELYADGHFSWQSVDSKLKYTKLYAAGRYAKNEKGQILFSHMKVLGYPYDRNNPALKTHFLALNETAFSFKIKDIVKSKYENEKVLILDIPTHNPEVDNSISPALSAFFMAMSGGKSKLQLKYMGTPIITNKRKLKIQ